MLGMARCNKNVLIFLRTKVLWVGYAPFPAVGEGHSFSQKGDHIMSTVIDKIEKEQMKQDVPEFGPGDTLKVHLRVVEGGKERIQIFQGIVLGRRGTGVNQAFTIRKISNGAGVERVFQIHSPKLAKIEVEKRGKVRRARLNYMRDRVGKQAVQVKGRVEEKKGA